MGVSLIFLQILLSLMAMSDAAVLLFASFLIPVGLYHDNARPISWIFQISYEV
jgi:hypothetical protein